MIKNVFCNSNLRLRARTAKFSTAQGSYKRDSAFDSVKLRSWLSTSSLQVKFHFSQCTLLLSHNEHNPSNRNAMPNSSLDFDHEKTCHVRKLEQRKSKMYCEHKVVFIDIQIWAPPFTLELWTPTMAFDAQAQARISIGCLQNPIIELSIEFWVLDTMLILGSPEGKFDNEMWASRSAMKLEKSTRASNLGLKCNFGM